MNSIPHFYIKRNSQKIKDSIMNSITASNLLEICKYITGLEEYVVDFLENDYQDDILPPTYNKGRLIILKYNGSVSYISISELQNDGRNSSIQSVPTAYNMFYKYNSNNKKLFYYFLHSMSNELTEYHFFIYRMMATVGFDFINATPQIKCRFNPFTSIDEIMLQRNILSSRNRSNNSTYINKTSKYSYEIYGKTYGANKYESSLMCYAISSLMNDYQKVTLFELVDNGLSQLPKSCLNVIKDMGNIKDSPLNLSLEKRTLSAVTTNDLRSPRYISNLFNKLGPKKCMLCDCEVSELIEGAHIWEVHQIRNDNTISDDDKYKFATDGDNGIWLCENHHKLFDQGLINIDRLGKISIDHSVSAQNQHYIENITTKDNLPNEVLTVAFLGYLERRYAVA